MEAMNFSKEMLVKEGRFVSKIFLGSSFNEIVALGKKFLKKLRYLNPNLAEKNPRKVLLFVKFKIETLILKGIIYKLLWIL